MPMHEAQLFGVDPMNPSIVILTFLDTLLVAALAAWPAAARATRIDATVALRAQ